MKTSALLTPPTLLASLLLALLPLQTHAAELEARIGWTTWKQNYGGNIDSSNNAIDGEVRITDDLGFDKKDGNTYYLVLEHPIGVVPNLKLQYTELEIAATSTLERDITYDDVSFNLNTDIASAIDFSHTDLTLYWHPVQGSLNIGVGFTIRLLDGSFKIASTDDLNSVTQTFDEILPLPYFQAHYKLRDTGLSAKAEFNGLAYSGDRFIDYTVQLAYKSKFGLGLEAGIRSISLRIEDLEVTNNDDSVDQLDMDIKVDGLFVGLFYSF